MRDYSALRDMPEDTVGQIEAKAARLRALTAQGASAWQLETACDLYIAAFLLPKNKGGPQAGADGMPRRGAEMAPTSGTLWEWLRGVTPYGPMFGAAINAARTARAFHWPLEFPDVMAKGGFDAVLGNPPWERIKLQEQEFFAARSPEIANASNKAARERLIWALEQSPEGTADRSLFDAFTAAKREAEAASEFVRTGGEDGGRFVLTGRGDVNTYALFAEHFANLAGQKGRAGVIVPTGIATDATTAPFFVAMTDGRKLASLFSFYEVRGWFNGTDDRKSFCLLTIGDAECPEFAFDIKNIHELGDSERRFLISTDEIKNINPNTRTAPIFRSRADAILTARIYSSIPILFDEAKGPAGNLWGMNFLTMFHMSNDSALFLTAEQLVANGFLRHESDWTKETERFVPLYEAKMIHQFDHRWATYDEGDSRDITSAEKIDPAFEPSPRYWVPAHEVEGRLSAKGWTRNWLMGWRDIALRSVERTVIAGVVPKMGVGHTSPLFFTTEEPALASAFLVNWSALVLDYVARQKVGGTHLTYGYLNQFPFLPPAFYTEVRLAFIVPRVLELTYTSDSLAHFALDLGYRGPPFMWDENRRSQLRADLDAFYARAYGLNRDELRYILDPADVKGPEYPSETFRVLKEKEIRQFGEYRTRRLVLEAWDRMEADGTFRSVGLDTGWVTATAPTAPKPTLATLPDGAWVRAAQLPNDAGAALTAILKTVSGPTPNRSIRLAAAMMLEPHLLTSLLSDALAQEWRRLVGQEAEPRSGNVVGFAARTNQGWGTAVSNHRGNGRLIENLTAATWAPGPGLAAFDTTGWPDGRAGFVLEALGSLDLDATLTTMPDEVRSWIRNVSAA